ncbi:hypothetical protein TMatcc_005905 [Talaromyces marneffei ATCC 18224]
MVPEHFSHEIPPTFPYRVMIDVVWRNHTARPAVVDPISFVTLVRMNPPETKVECYGTIVFFFCCICYC